LNHKASTTIHLDEIIPPPTNKNVPVDYKLSQQSSTSSNNLLRPDNNPWNNNNTNESDLMRIKSPSISNIAGKIDYFQRLKSFSLI
jgi:hypothetical protein